MSLTSYAYSLFIPSAAIILLGVTVLFFGWLSEKIAGRHENEVLEQFRATMRKSLPPIPVIATPPQPSFPPSLPPVLRVPLDARPPPLPMRKTRLPKCRLPKPPDKEESSITGRYTQEELSELMRRAT
jgi:hypothetical protein